MIECKILTFRKIIQWHPAHFKGNSALFSCKIVSKKTTLFFRALKWKSVSQKLFLLLKRNFSMNQISLILSKKKFFFDNFNNFIRKLTQEQKKSVFSTLWSPLDLWSFSLISQHPREVKKPYLGASRSMSSEGASCKCKFSEKTQKIRFFLSWHVQKVISQKS